MTAADDERGPMLGARDGDDGMPEGRDAVAADETPAQPDDPNDVRKFCVLCRSGQHEHGDDARPAGAADQADALDVLVPRVFRDEVERITKQRDAAWAELAETKRKVEALLLGDKALSSRIWLGEEVARLKAELAEARDQAAWVGGQYANAKGSSDVFERTMKGAGAEVVRLQAQLAEAIRERDEARAKAVDGGEWQWGVRYESPDNSHESWEDWTRRQTHDYVIRYNNINSSLSKATLIRQWRGPVEVVGDDGSGT